MTCKLGSNSCNKCYFKVVSGVPACKTWSQCKTQMSQCYDLDLSISQGRNAKHFCWNDTGCWAALKTQQKTPHGATYFIFHSLYGSQVKSSDFTMLSKILSNGVLWLLDNQWQLDKPWHPICRFVRGCTHQHLPLMISKQKTAERVKTSFWLGKNSNLDPFCFESCWHSAFTAGYLQIWSVFSEMGEKDTTS